MCILLMLTVHSKEELMKIQMAWWEFFPKNFDFSTINQNHVDIVDDILNNRPRKCLGYKTPLEAFNEEQAKCCT